MTTRVIPAGWMPAASISRIIGHWTAGHYTPTDFDRGHYHVLIDGSAKPVRGIPSIALNSHPKAQKGYAAHTLNCNTGSIGISIAAMAGAVEAPFKAGKAPITKGQWMAFVLAIADLCERYRLPVTAKTVLTHAEVQANLGIKQRNKWDIAVLPFDLKFNTAKKVGDRLRAEVQAALGRP
jgi:N-acetyl-anhydromuramyl-L-alanine amidase AmpD